MKKLFIATFLILALNVKTSIAQTITGVSIAGATTNGSSSTWAASWTSNAADSNLAYVKPVKLYLSGFGSSTRMFMSASNNSSIWQMQFGSTNSNAWKTFCYDKVVGKQDSFTIYIRNKSGTSGTFTNQIYIGVGDCATGVTSITLSVTVTVVNAGVYTWVGTSGIDSTYGRAANWAPIRTTPATTDVLLVDLGSASQTSRTTIDISGVTETIGQFKILPYNHVDFKCTTNNAAWTVGNATSITGNDFIHDSTSTMRKSGGAVLDIIVPTNNTADINGRLVMTSGSGTLKFSGSGQHNVSSNISCLGGLLSFEHGSTGNRILYFDGKNQTLSGTAGSLTIGTKTPLVVGLTNTSSTLTLSRKLDLYNTLTLLNNTTISSTGGPASSSAADWNAWEPFLRFRNDGTNRGQLATLPTTYSLTADNFFEIYCNPKRSYRAYGIPLKNGVNLSQFADDITVTGTAANGNKDSFETGCSYCKTSAFGWNETTGAWSGYQSGATATNIANGQGLLLFYRGTYSTGLGDTTITANANTIDFKGQLHTGNKVISGLTKSTGTFAGYNLIGNPYPADVNLHEFFATNSGSIHNRFLFYDAVAKTYNIYDSTSSSAALSGTNNFKNNASGKAKILTAGAAVFTIAKSNNVSVTFTEAMKITTRPSTTSNFKESDTTNKNNNELSVDLFYDNDTSSESDNFVVQFDNMDADITNDFDFFDIQKFYAGYLGLGSLTNNGTWCAIDRRGKLAEPGKSVVIPTRYKTTENGNYKLAFSVPNAETSLYDIQLIDKENGSINTITPGFVYRFSKKDSDVFKTDRFDIQFTGKVAGTKNVAINNQTIIYPNPSTTGHFNIVSNEPILSYSINTMEGKAIQNETVNNPAKMLEINLNNTNISGLLIINIKTASGQTSKLIQIQK